MTTDDARAEWDDLARLAEAIHPEGRDWHLDRYGDGWQVNGAGTVFADAHARRDDAEFIAAANPATILRLIRELQQQRHRTAEFQTIAAGFANRAVAAEDQLAAVEVLSWELSPADGPRLRAALAAPTDTTKEPP